jgi:hypothetical protein
MQRKWWWSLVIVLAFAALFVVPVRADMVTTYLEGYTNWQAASTSVKTIDFELGRPLKNGNYELFNTAAGLSLQATGALPSELTNFNSWYVDPNSGITKYNMFISNPSPGDSSYWASGMELKGTVYRPDQQTRIRIALPTGGETSVGLDLRSEDNTGQSFQIVLYKDATFTPFYTAASVPTQDPGASNYHSFWGATADVPITRMDLILLGGTAYTTIPIIDNVRYGGVATVSGGGGGGTDVATPEPPTGMVYLTVAGLSLLAARRLKLRSTRPRKA